MTTQQKLQAVTEAIHKACPDLLKLKEGCKIMFNFDGAGWKEWQLMNSERSDSDYISIGTEDKVVGINKRLCDFKILGQPIGIAEVLRAINSVISDDWIVMCYSDGTLRKKWNIIGPNPPDPEECFFDLTKTLDQQEEPVISLLYSILCP